MPKIESIRPSGTLDGNLGEYPLADLLLGVLRGNLTGRLDLALAAQPRNHVFFKDGVPISVSVPDLGVSVARILLERGDITREHALEIMREAEESGRTESALIVEDQILPSGTVDEARRRRARQQVVRLFDAGAVKFCFTEGALIGDDAVLTILQPLPIVFEGLLQSKDRRIVARFLEENGSASFKLAATYPHGVDPFEWGERVEAIVQQMEQPRSLDELEELGLQRDIGAVALTTLFLAGMIEVQRSGDRGRSERRPPGSQLEYVTPRGDPMPMPGSATPSGGSPVAGRPPRSSPRMEPLTPAQAPANGGEDREPSGLVVHRRSSGAPERVRSERVPPVAALESRELSRELNGTRPIPRSELAAEGYAAQLEGIASKLGTLRGKSYFKMLRVAEGSAADQIERSYRHLIRQVEEAGDDPANRALKDALREAYEVLSQGVEGRRYRDLAERAKQSPQAVAERQAYEATPKIDRAVRAMAEGRTAEAAYLLEWAQALDPARREIKVYRGLLGYFRAPRAHRTGEALALKPLVAQELQRAPHDMRMRLSLALILAEEGEARAATEILDDVPEADHPLARRVRELLGA